MAFHERAFASLAAGGLGAMVGNPADLCLIRMQADGTLPEAERRNYKNVGDALTRIVREEGPLALWKGCLPTVYRAMALNFGMLTFFGFTKDKLEPLWGASKTTTLTSSAVAGFFASFFSLPFDYVKTKLQKMKPDAKGVLPYKGFFDCFGKTMAREGVTGLWTGFPTYYSRIAPHAMITLMCADFLKSVLTNKQ